MLNTNCTEMITHKSAVSMAETFRQCTARLVACLKEAEEQTEMLRAMFKPGDRWAFGYEIEFRSRRVSIESLPKLYKLQAWSNLIDHVGVRKIMSAKRQNELNAILHSQNPDAADQLPDISEDTILQVLEGYAASADEFLTESVQEIYDWLKPWSNFKELKTNQKNRFALSPKVIVRFAVNEYGGGSHYDIEYNTQARVTALDNVFHLLDGQGIVKTTYGPLSDAIKTTKTASGETDYFKFRCFTNRNLHLTIKRQDLLDKFNAICGRNRLDGQADHA